MASPTGRGEAWSLGVSGDIRSRFRIREVLGRGGMGVVYRAYDEEVCHDIALKTLLRLSQDDVYNLKREFRSLVDIVHPNLVELYELVVEDGACFFTMELVDGRGLVEYVRGGSPARAAVDRDRLVRAVRQLVLGLSAVHDAGRVHRDVKPSNVMVTRTGRVVLLDFGLFATLRPDDPLGAEADVAGTPAYMAPEQMWGRPASPAADYYSVGAVLREILIGEPSFSGTAPEMLAAKERGLPPEAGAEDDLMALARALLDPDPMRRPDAAQMLAHLDRAGGGAAPSSPRVGGGETPFLGRTAELGRLRASLDRVAGGRPAVVHVAGPSGIGKTELIRRFLHLVEAEDHGLVLRGRCYPQEFLRFRALDGAIDALSRHLATFPEPEIAELAGADVDCLLRLFPVLTRVRGWPFMQPSQSELEPLELRRRAFVAFGTLLGRLSRRRPVILWIDDVQWGDSDSISLLRDLLRVPDAPRMMVLLSHRSEDPGARAIVEELDPRPGDAARPTVEELDVAPLTGDAALALTRELLAAHAAASGDVVTQVAAESGGSPFLVGELVRHLTTVARPGVGGGAVQLEELTRERIRDLPPQARPVLELVAVSGAPLERALALEAAGMAPASRPILAMLGERSLLRLTTIGHRPAVEMFHDRIREAVIAGLSDSDRRRHHRNLAEALGRTVNPSQEALARHWHGCGENERAAEYAEQAAERAESTLAFARAAELYGVALAWRPHGRNAARRLRLRQADALVNAGRSAAAGRLYGEVATDAVAEEGHRLRLKATEQLLAAGELDDGVAVLRPLLAQLGLGYPETSRAALLESLVRLLVLRLRGLGFAEAVRPSLLALNRVDICHAAAKALVPMDAARGVHFMVRGLGLALRAGDSGRVAWGLAAVGAGLEAMGSGELARFGERMMDAARPIIDRLEDPYLRGHLAVSQGQVKLFQGQWRSALELSEAGVHQVSERCRGVRYECNVGRMLAMRALEELGEFLDMERHAYRLLRDAEDAGDVYAEVTALLNLGWLRMVADDARGARKEAQRALRRWSRSGFHVQHLYALRIETYCDLYENDEERAHERVRAAWPELRAAALHRLPLPRTDSLLLRARAALALAARRRDRTALIRSVEHDARRLFREPRVDASAHAGVLQAAAASLRDERERAATLLVDSAGRFDRLGMPLQAAYARDRQGLLLGGNEGRMLQAKAKTAIRALGVRRPERWIAVQAPGFPGG